MRRRRRRRWRPLVCASLAWCALLAASPAAAAVDDYIGKDISAVRLVLEGRDTIDPALVRLVETRVGEALAVAAVRETITHLFSLGRFDDIRVDATLEGGRVALRYELSPIHPVESIQFTGPLRAPGVDI